jgi:Zn ribbon nucleic-acid-binding protein
MEDLINTECPNCNAIWGFDEIDWNMCYSCGYPDHEEEEEEEIENQQ